MERSFINDDFRALFTCMEDIANYVHSDYACITLSNRILVSSTGWSRLTQAEQHILTYLIALNDYSNDILPTSRDIPIYLDSIDRSHNYRLVSVRLLGQIYVSIICSSEPKMSEFESVVDRHCHPKIELIQNLNNSLYPRSFHDQIVFDPNVQALLYVNHQTHFCVSTFEPSRSAPPLSTTLKKHRYQILRNFYLEIVRIEKEKMLNFNGLANETKLNEMYLVSSDPTDPHKCYFLREDDFLQVFILFDVQIPTVAMRGIARKLSLF